MDSWIVTANTTSTTSTTGTTSIASTSVTNITSTSTAANARAITTTCSTPTQKRNLNVDSDSPYSNTSEVFKLNVGKRRTLENFPLPTLIKKTVAAEIHHVDEENLIESNTRKRQGFARKITTKTHRGENNQGKEKLIESCKRKGVFSDDSSENQIKSLK